MEAIRHIITSVDNQVAITIPDNFVNQRLEIIVLPIGSNSLSELPQYKSLMGSVSQDEALQMLRHIEETREEWE